MSESEKKCLRDTLQDDLYLTQGQGGGGGGVVVGVGLSTTELCDWVIKGAVWTPPASVLLRGKEYW